MFNSSGQFGRIGCFFHCCVAGADFLAKCAWRTGQSWCHSILQRGTAASGLWNEVVEPLIAADIGQQNADGFVEVDQLKQWFKELEPYGEMRPVLDFIGQSQQQLLAQFVELSEVAKHMQPAGQEKVRRVYLLLAQDKFSVAVTQFGWEHFLHWDPHAATPGQPDQSVTLVARSGEEIIGMMTRRGVYKPETCCSLYLSLPQQFCHQKNITHSHTEFLWRISEESWCHHVHTMYQHRCSIGVRSKWFFMLPYASNGSLKIF